MHGALSPTRVVSTLQFLLCSVISIHLSEFPHYPPPDLVLPVLVLAFKYNILGVPVVVQWLTMGTPHLLILKTVNTKQFLRGKIKELISLWKVLA